jgi:hypothetical protein
VPFPELLDRWGACTRVDPYALADLATFRGVLGQLLKRSLRRALYSGDYHQIQRREAALATRVAELEALHHRTWSEPPEAHEVQTYGQMQRLTLELAAILDSELLEHLVGSSALKDLRQAVATDRAAAGDQTFIGYRPNEWVRAARRPLGELECLVPLLAGDDLKTFLSLLLASVLKRASLNGQARRAPPRVVTAPDAAAAVPAEARSEATADEAAKPAAAAAPPPFAAPAEDAGELLPPIDIGDTDGRGDSPLLPPATQEKPAPRARSKRSLRDRAGGALDDDGGAALPSMVPPPPLPEPTLDLPALAPSPATSDARRDTLEGLHRLLQFLQSPENAHWSSFRMLQRLLQRHARVPPSIVQGAHPFVWDVLNGLVPQLEAAASLGAVPQEARKRLVECCLALTDDALSPEQMVAEVPGQLSRLHRLLEALTAATGAQLRAQR